MFLNDDLRSGTARYQIDSLKYIYDFASFFVIVVFHFCLRAARWCCWKSVYTYIYIYEAVVLNATERTAGEAFLLVVLSFDRLAAVENVMQLVLIISSTNKHGYFYFCT